ncbi:fumarylacetoacetate hydrolase family protein [Mycobacterium sp. DSM 3803]|nr:fumarylacetoacetate hydrolase family protein [Mycobacterium sp. DSM 3803]
MTARRIARIAHPGGVHHATVEADGYALIDNPFAHRLRHTGIVVPAHQARLLAPVTPRTVVGMAHNTGSADRRLPPQGFLKPATTVTGPGASIPLPAGIGRVDAEAELAVVIGRSATRLTTADAADHILGVTVANDVTARDLQQSDPLWFAAKGFDGWTPLGPWIATGLDTADLAVGLRVDGIELAPAGTADLARSVIECLIYVTSVLTLHPGDVVLTGAPGGTGAITAGSTVTATIAGVGELHNPVAAADDQREVA